MGQACCVSGNTGVRLSPCSRSKPSGELGIAKAHYCLGTGHRKKYMFSTYCCGSYRTTHEGAHTFVGTRRPWQGRDGRTRASATLRALSCTDPPPPPAFPSWLSNAQAGPGPPDPTGPPRELSEELTPPRQTCDATRIHTRITEASDRLPSAHMLDPYKRAHRL